MANVALEKLSVAETLIQATKALQTHQNWMKERISRIAPLDVGPFQVHATEREPKQKTAWDDSGEGGPNAFVGVSTSGGSGEETHRGTCKAGGSHAAPPPFEMQARGGSERVRKRSRLARVAPARALGSLAEDASGLEKGGHKLQVAWGSTTDLQSRDKFNDEGHDQTEKRKGEEPIVSEAATKSKKRHLSAASVVPSETTDSAGQTGPPGNPKSAGMFLSTPPPVASFSAWGSLTSLDNYMESLQEFPRVDTSAGSSSDSGAKTVVREKVAADSSIATAVPVVPAAQQPESPPSQAGERSVPRAVSTAPSDLESPKGSSHDISDGSELQEDAFGSTSEHIEVLQSASSATIVPVSPAPKDQRSSYALHQQSKLTSSEAGLELLKVEPGAMSGKESAVLSSSVLLANKKESKPLKTHDLPESILKPVLPAGRQRRTGATVMSTLLPTVETRVTDSESKRQATDGSHYQGDGVQPILQTPSELMDPTLDIMGSVSTHKLTAAQSSDGSSTTLASQHSLLSEEVTSAAVNSRQLPGARQDKSAPMATKVHPANQSTVPPGDTQPLPSASHGAQYEDLNLPPLKKQPGHNVYIG